MIARIIRLLPLVVAFSVQAQGGAESPRQVLPDAAGAELAAKKLEEARQRLKKTGEDTYEIGEIKFNSRTHEITFPALLNMTEGLLEYALVHEHGKTHESLLSTKVSPAELNLAMLLCHYEAHLGEVVKHLPDLLPATRSLAEKAMERPGANRIHAMLGWKDKEGQEKRVPLADWIHDKNTGKSLDVNHWTYTGSVVNEVGFVAEFDGSIIGIYFDMVAMINCPSPDNNNDEIWQVETKDVPALETPVTVIITPASKDTVSNSAN